MTVLKDYNLSTAFKLKTGPDRKDPDLFLIEYNVLN